MLQKIYSTLVLVALSQVGSAAEAPAAGSCPRTLGSAKTFAKPFPPSDSWYGTEALATIILNRGVWTGMGSAARFRNKLWFWSYGFKPGDERHLKVKGRRLDARSAPADISRAANGYENAMGWAMLVAVEFPAAGCWQITADYLGQKLQFVTEVRDSTP